MLSDKQIEKIAQSHLSQHYPSACEILGCERRSNPDGIYFWANRRTDNQFESYLGDGGFFVTRDKGEVWTFGSGQIIQHGLESWLRFYAEGWRLGVYRLTVRYVMEPELFAKLVVNRSMNYLIREIESGVVWHRWAEYDEDLVLRRIRLLPCTFPVGAEQLRSMIPRLESQRIATFEYSYAGTIKEYDTHPENNRKDELGPQFEWA